MSFLTDTDLKKIVIDDRNCEDSEKLIISPFSNTSLTPVGYDLRVGSPYVTTGEKIVKNISENEEIILLPTSTSLITTLEYIKMPENRCYSGLIASKVSKVSKGLSHISTTVDADWKGKLLIAVHNHSAKKITLRYGETFCTMVLFINKSPTTEKSSHDAGRSDLLLSQFAEDSTQEQKRRKLLRLIPPFTIFSISFAGYLFFGNHPGFSAMVVLSVALSQYISERLR